MIKRIALIITLIAFSAPAFAGLENTVGHAAWTVAENNTGTATFGVGNATNSFTDWLVVPDAAEWASVQICDSTSATTVNYVYSAAVDSARFRGAITNATFSVEVSNLSISSATPAITTGDIPVFDIITSATSAGAAPGAAFGPRYLWNDYTAPSIPVIQRKGLYRFPTRGAKVLRLKMDRSGVSVAYQWAIVRFDKR